MLKTKFNDGLWERETHYGPHKIKLTTWRTPHCWETKAESDYGHVTSSSSNGFASAKNALKNLRLNLPIWYHLAIANKGAVCYNA